MPVEDFIPQCNSISALCIDHRDRYHDVYHTTCVRIPSVNMYVLILYIVRLREREREKYIVYNTSSFDGFATSITFLASFYNGIKQENTINIHRF
jgi:hypothetical protein